jgi:hypothetical protein
MTVPQTTFPQKTFLQTTFPPKWNPTLLGPIFRPKWALGRSHLGLNNGPTSPG